MTFQITYRKNNEQHSLEWIAPTGWSTTAIRACFIQRFPQAEIITIEAQQ